MKGTVSSEGRVRSRKPWRGLLVLLYAGIFALSAFIFGGYSLNAPAHYGFLVVSWTLAAAIPAFLYVAGAVGLGVLFDPLTRGMKDRWGVRAGLGLSLQLSLSHLLGWSGLLFQGGVGWWPVIVGLGLLIFALFRERGTQNHGGGTGILSMPALALVAVAACSAPGWLWGSEFGGYDALSYHLQLPQEWIAAGRIVPLTHNVYSYLPGYMECAFTHVGVLLGAAPPAVPGESWGLLRGDGNAALACQILHATIGVLAAWITGRLAYSIAIRSFDETQATLCAMCAGGFVLATPWIIVVGSLAYNEMGMLALLGAALIVAFDGDISSWRKGVLCGWLVGVACGVKPTALLMAGLPVGVVMFAVHKPNQWVVLAGAGCAAGLAALAPWLARNIGACGNPVFPYGAAIFGSGHWTSEQVTRFAGGHRFGGNLVQRFLLVFLPDPNDPAGARHRGLMHPQWAGFGPLLLASVCVVAATVERRREIVLLAVAVGAQLLAWLFTTHVQSRFLLPLIVPGSVVIAIALQGVLGGAVPMGTGPLKTLLVRAVSGVPVAIQLVFSAVTFFQERGGNPNATLLAGAAVFSGEGLREQFAATPEADRERLLEGVPSEVSINLTWPHVAGGQSAKLFLLGDSTPFYLAVPLEYHTTWDTSVLGEAVRSAHNDPKVWAERLRERGHMFVFVDRAEVARLSKNGWYDPAVTPEVLQRFLREACTAVKEWPGADGSMVRGLYRLQPSATPAAPTPSNLPGGIR